MARCDEGYLCEVCGLDVAAVTESDLYLRYVMGEIDPIDLPKARERHIRCVPETAQYIVDSKFAPVRCEGMFDKAHLDADFVRERETQVTRAWCRLQEIPALGIPLTEYPLPEVLASWRSRTYSP